MPSSSVEVQTMQAFVPCANLSSATFRSSSETELWWTKTSVPLTAHAFGDRLRERAALAEEEALLAPRLGRRLVREARHALVEADDSVALRGVLRRVDDDALTPRGGP